MPDEEGFQEYYIKNRILRIRFQCRKIIHQLSLGLIGFQQQDLRIGFHNKVLIINFPQMLASQNATTTRQNQHDTFILSYFILIFKVSIQKVKIIKRNNSNQYCLNLNRLNRQKFVRLNFRFNFYSSLNGQQKQFLAMNAPLHLLRRAQSMHQSYSQVNSPDYSFIYQFIKLPTLKKLHADSNPIPKPEKQLIEATFISKKLKQNALEQRELLQNQFAAFQYQENFQFYFPVSLFQLPPNGQNNNVSYEKKKIVEDEETYREKLSPEQIKQIKQKGQFEVKSSRQWVKLPYIWKLNETIFKGMKNIKRDWNERLSLIHQLFTNAWEMLSENLPEEIMKIGKIPWKFFALFFGKKQIQVSYSVDYHREIAKDFWNEVISKHYTICKQWGSQIWNFFDLKFESQIFQDIANDGSIQLYRTKKLQRQQLREEYQNRVNKNNEKINKMNQISNLFEGNWNKISKKIIMEITDKIQKNDLLPEEINKKYQTNRTNEILQAFHEEEFRYYYNFIDKQFHAHSYPQTLIEAVLALLTLMNITLLKYRVYQRKTQQKRAQIQIRIQKQYPIRSLLSKWYTHKLNSDYSEIEQSLKEQFQKSLFDNNLTKILNPNQITVFKLWIEYIHNYSSKIQQKKQQKQDLYEPSNIYSLVYMLLPTYKIIKHQQDPLNQRSAYYEMIKSRQTQVTTAHHCWKLFLYCTRLKTWTINTFVTLIYLGWSGPFGLRCLCGIDDFTYDQQINSTTGEIHNYTRKTVLANFITTIEGIKRSRTQFENQPDRGIFGKNCSRIYNLLECYIFRFFIVGLIFILTLYPVAIVLLSFFVFLLLITVWVWVPMALIVVYLFNIFIFSFELENEKNTTCMLRMAPFINILIRLLVSIFKVFLYISSFFVFMPIFSLLILFYAFICRFLRYLSDHFILCFLGCCGHVPSTNTCIASKVSGPGVASRYFMSINEEDVYYLIQAELEQIHVQKVSELTRQMIRAPFQKYKKTLQLLFGSLIARSNNSNANSSSNISFDQNSNPISKANLSVEKRFNELYSEYLKRYPKRPNNVRFNQQQLNLYFQNTIQIVKFFVHKHKIWPWIFIHFNLHQEDYQQLTKKIWVKTFQCGEDIFNPLQSIDEVFKLEDQYRDNSSSYNKMRFDVSNVIKAIKGEVNLEKQKIPKVGLLNQNLFSQRIPVFKVSQMLQMMQNNSNNMVMFNQSDPSFLYYPALSIKQVIKYEDQNYMKQKQSNNKKMKSW